MTKRRQSKADVKGRLAGLGQNLDPDAALRTVSRPKPGESGNIIVLERVRAGELPEYCVHGYAECISCYELCWLGHETERVVVTRRAYPMCLECANAVLPPGHTPATRVHDHRRADGPHEQPPGASFFRS